MDNDAKKITITWNNNRPQYLFEGNWIGREVKVAVNKMWDNGYKRFVIDKRKEEEAKQKPIEEKKDDVRTEPTRVGKKPGRPKRKQ